MVPTAPEVLLTNAGELVDWAEHEGWLDDSVIVAAHVDAKQKAHVRMGLRLGEPTRNEQTGDATQGYLEFSLVIEDADVPTDIPVGAFEISSLIEDGKRFGIAIDVGARSVSMVGKSIAVVEHGETRRSVTIAFGDDLCFRGPGPITIEGLRHVIELAGTTVDVYANWKGSGHMMGSAFVTNTAPELVTSGRFAGAMRVVRAGSDATSTDGLWLTGQSLESSAYVNVEVGTASRELVSAVVRGLAALANLTSASSGNASLRGLPDLERWLASRVWSASPK